MILALVPAGGRGRRMGRPKLTLPLGDRTVIEHVIASLTLGGADHVLVVAGPHDPQLATIAAGAETPALAGNVIPANPPPMIATVPPCMFPLPLPERPSHGERGGRPRRPTGPSVEAARKRGPPPNYFSMIKY